MNRILSLQFYLVSSSSAAPWPGALPLQLQDPNYGNGDTNTFSKRMFGQFTQYLTRWQICQLPLSSEGSKLFSFRGGAFLTPWPGALPLDAGGSAPRPPLQPPHSKPLASPLGYAVARCLYVRLSVRLLVTRRYSVETAKHILKVLSPWSSQTILVFPYQTGWQYSDGTP